MRSKILLGAIVCSISLLAACGGGGNGAPQTTTATPPPGGGTVPRSVVPISTASPGTFHIYQVPTVSASPVGIAVGPDRVYFTEMGTSKIGSIKYDGTFDQELSLPDSGVSPSIIEEAIDGTMWFSESSGSNIGRLAPASLGNAAITEWHNITNPSCSASCSGEILSDPNGVLWISERGTSAIIRVTTWGSFLTNTQLTTGSGPNGLTAGSDSNSVWAAEWGSNKIAKFDLSGNLIAEYGVTTGSRPTEVATGSDGNVYFSENVDPNALTQQSYIGKVTPSGTISYIQVPRIGATLGIASGPDGNIWFALRNSTRSSIDKLNVATQAITEYNIPVSSDFPQQIVSAPDGQLWFTLHPGNAIGSLHP